MSNKSELLLVDQNLTEVPLEIAKKFGPTATTLNLSENSFKAPGNLIYFTSVNTLVLDKNNLESLDGFPVMPTVTTLWINKNMVCFDFKHLFMFLFLLFIINVLLNKCQRFS